MRHLRKGRRVAALFFSLFLCASASLKAEPIFVPIAEIKDPPAAVDETFSATPSSPLQTIKRSDDDLVLVQFRLGNQIISEAIPGYVDKTLLLLPLGEVSSVLQFDIRVQPKDGQAQGWFVREENTFSLDALRLEAIIAGTRTTFTEGQVEPHNDDIYVDANLLAEWFGIDFNFSFSTQTVTLVPREGVMLPVMLAADRESRRAKLAVPSSAAPLPKLSQPYSLATLPFADIDYSISHDDKDSEPIRQRGTALINGDALYMHGSAFISANESGVDDVRVTLSRKDPDGQLFSSDEAIAHTAIGETFNELEVRELSIGDVFTPQLPLTALNQNGRGVLITNQPFDRATEFNRTSLQGNIQPGWDVELYRNDELLSFQRASSDARYEFRDVPLLSGINVLRLVFYGPYGEIREEVQRLLVSPELTKQGQSYFRFSATQQESNVIDLEDTKVSGSFQPDIDPFTEQQTKGKSRVTAEYEYGITDNVALFGQVVHLPAPNGNGENYVTAAVATVLADTYLRLDTSQASEGGNAVQLNMQTSLWDINLSAEQQFFHDFISDFTESAADPVKYRTTVRVDMPLSVPLLPRLSIGFAGNRIEYESGRERQEFNNRVSTTLFSRAALSHTLIYVNDEDTLLTRERTTRGEALISFPIGPLFLRGDASYNIDPKVGIDRIALTGDYAFDVDTLVRGEVSRQMVGEEYSSYGLALNHRFESFQAGINARYDSSGDVAVGLTVSLSVGEEPRSGRLALFPDASARDGMVSARTYFDANNNGLYDDGDTLAPQARYLVNNGNASNQKSFAEDNVTLIRSMPTPQKANVSLNTGSVDNPYWVAKDPGYAVVTRPGVPVLMDIAVQASTDIEGTVHLESAESNLASKASNVRVQMVNGNGIVIRETRTAYDGYYLLDLVPPGTYSVRIAPEQLDRLGLDEVNGEAQITITGEEESIRGRDFTLRKTSP